MGTFTRRAFSDWLALNHADRVGRAGDEHDCPLRNFLYYECGHPGPVVYHNAWITGGKRRHERTLPLWAQAAVERIDDAADDGEELTGAQTLALLKKKPQWDLRVGPVPLVQEGWWKVAVIPQVDTAQLLESA